MYLYRLFYLFAAASVLVACSSGSSDKSEDFCPDPAYRDSLLLSNNTISYAQNSGSFDMGYYSFVADDAEKAEESKKALSVFKQSVKEMSDSERSYMRACYEDLADLATMAQYAYKDSDVDLPYGWVDMNIKHPALGLKCSLLAKGNRYVLAFAGTDFPADWKNPKQIMDFLVDAYEDVDGAINNDASQIRQASALISEMVQSNNISLENLEFTGHSLGGRIAAEMAVEYGCPAVLFNAAGVSPDVYEAYLELRKKPVSERSGYIINVTSANDQLTCLQKYMSGSSDPYLNSIAGLLTDENDVKDKILSIGKSVLGKVVDKVSDSSASINAVMGKVDEYYNRDYKALGARLIVSEDMEGHGIKPLVEALRHRAESI